MKIAMIAALSCAVLCGPCAALQAHGYQCESGQANLSLEYVGHYDRMTLTLKHTERSPFELYRAQIVGKSAIDAADIPGSQGVDGMKIYLAVAQNAPVELPHNGKGDLMPGRVLDFERWLREPDQNTALFWVLGKDPGHDPEVAFSASSNVRATLTFAVNPAVVKDATKLKASDFRVYLAGKRKTDGQTFTLFDTSKPCKE